MIDEFHVMYMCRKIQAEAATTVLKIMRRVFYKVSQCSYENQY